jgi:choline dehydrogenase-like flavoprotein
MYGPEAENRLRIQDASVLQLFSAAHLQATMYAVAEKAAKQ